MRICAISSRSSDISHKHMSVHSKMYIIHNAVQFICACMQVYSVCFFFSHSPSLSVLFAISSDLKMAKLDDWQFVYVLWLYRFKKPFTKLHWQVSMCCKCVNDHTIWCIDFGFLFFKEKKTIRKMPFQIPNFLKYSCIS